MPDLSSIVVGTDGSEPATKAVEWAAADAARRGLALRIVHVCERWGFPEERGYCEGALAAAADHARLSGPGVEMTTELLPGHVVETLVRESATADSVVLGSRGLGGFGALLLGSVGLAVAGHAEAPVVIVREPERPERGEVVAGFDGSEHSEAALDYALEQALARGVRLHTVYAWQMPVAGPHAAGSGEIMARAADDASGIARERLARWRDEHGHIEVKESFVCEHPVAALVDASKTAALLVVGSRGMGGFASAVLGSVSHGVLHHAHCPVAVVRPRKEAS
ncbi:universal stress protein [Nonomuraea sp. bgisy101]|uniref:universal stress protein n=1 Tax=Nonomuraea sp. bgisy101 TaxID=3413784 RepID=UPI003D751AC4